MKRTLFRTLVVTAALASTAHAAKDMQSEYYHQAAGMTQELSPTLDYRSSNTQAKSAAGIGTSTATTSGFGLYLDYDYGLNEDMAISVDLGFENYNTSVSPDNTTANSARNGIGLTDLSGRFQGRVPAMGPGNFVYGTKYNLNLIRPTVNQIGGAANGSLGVQEGYHFLMPYIGYEMNLGPGIAGLHFDYEVLKSDRRIDYTTNNGTVITIINRGGNHWMWGAFYEIPHNEWLFGLSVDSLTTNDSSRQPIYNNASINRESRDNASVDLITRLYMTYTMDKDLTLTPSAYYTTLSSKYREGVETDSDNEMGIALSARFAF